MPCIYLVPLCSHLLGVGTSKNYFSVCLSLPLPRFSSWCSISKFEFKLSGKVQVGTETVPSRVAAHASVWCILSLKVTGQRQPRHCSGARCTRCTPVTAVVSGEQRSSSAFQPSWAVCKCASGLVLVPGTSLFKSAGQMLHGAGEKQVLQCMSATGAGMVSETCTALAECWGSPAPCCNAERDTGGAGWLTWHGPGQSSTDLALLRIWPCSVEVEEHCSKSIVKYAIWSWNILYQKFITHFKWIHSGPSEGPGWGRR